jgi:hypothetical protein
MGFRGSLLLLLLSGLYGQTLPGATVSSRDGIKPTSILSESYQLSKGLVPSDRAILLNYLTLTAAKHRLACTSNWAEENLLLARQLPMDWNRIAIEKNAVVALSYVKPSRAMTLIRSMDPPVSDGVGFPEDVRSDGARIIFQNYWRGQRPRGLPELRAEAIYLGQTGQYPYRAVQNIVVDLVAEAPKEKGQLPIAAQSFVSDAYSFFRRGSKFQLEDDDFVEFLQTLHAILPTSLLRQGVELAVERLFDTDRPLDKQGYLSHIQTEKGDAVFRRRQEKLLFDILPLVREIDPNWAAQIVHRDPNLGQAEGNSGKEIMSEGVINPGGPEPVNGGSRGLQQSRADAASALSQTNPEGAVQLAQSISDPSIRTVALANIANVVWQSQPDRATEIEKTIGNIVPTVKNAEDRLEVLSALVRAAKAARDLATLHEALDKCFALGEELFDEGLAAFPVRPTYVSPSYNVLNDVIEATVSLEPATITSKVDQIRNVALRAYLLRTLAEAIYSEQDTSVAPKQAVRDTSNSGSRVKQN